MSSDVGRGDCWGTRDIVTKVGVGVREGDEDR